MERRFTRPPGRVCDVMDGQRSIDGPTAFLEETQPETA
jgi:hypothetical protein